MPRPNPLMQALNELSISLQLTLLITGIETFRRPTLKFHSLRGAKPVCLTQRCFRISSGTFGTPFERRYCSVAQTTRRTWPTGIATREESLRCAIRTATSTCSSPRFKTRSPNRRSMVTFGWRRRKSLTTGATLASAKQDGSAYGQISPQLRFARD